MAASPSIAATQGTGPATLPMGVGVSATSSTQNQEIVQSPVVAVNVPGSLASVPTVPLTVQMPAVNTMPIAMCAVNSQQMSPAPVQNTMPQPAALQQPNAGSGNIIVLNVGGGNNLAAAISQLVAGGLIPQQQVAQALAPTNPPETQASSMATHQPSQLPAQTSLPVAAQMQIPVQQQSQPQSPAAFMIVPIQQMPAATGQGGQVRAPSSYVTMEPSQQVQQQQQVFVNIPNQVVPSYSNQTNVMTPNVVQALPQALTPQPTQAILVNNAQTLSVPRNDELKAFLTQSFSSVQRPVNTALTSSTGHIATGFAPAQLQYAASVTTMAVTPPTPTQASSLTPTTMAQVQQLPRPSTPQNAGIKFQTTVSSPGLAFLAQVSSLSASHHALATGAQPGPSVKALNLSMATAASAVHQIIEQQANQEVNNNLQPMPPENGKLLASAIDSPVLARTCSTPSSSMMVSSTTKLGDENIPEILEGSTVEDHPTEITVTEIHEITDKNLPFQTNMSVSTSQPDKKGVKEKRKKGPAPKLLGTELCLICGDKASGFHYNTLSCEGCKGFFRRSVIKGAKYQCKMNGDCQMDLFMRRKCQKCRFQKCKAVGMKEESVLSEEQVKAKKLKKEHDGPFSPMHSLSEDGSTPTLTPQQRNLVELLKANEKRFQWPTTEDMKKVTAWVEDDDSIHSRALRFAHFTELCILIVQLVVEFTKQLPGFLTVLREDQIVLLKACAIEVMLLRAAKQYNKHDGTINFLNGKLYDKSSFYRAGMQVEFVDPIFQFCKSMARLDLDDTEYAILVAINTFSTDRPHIKDIEKVECMQDPYVELLRVYSRIRHPNDPLMFARILMKIVELRTLNNYHSEQIFALKVQDRKLPPLLAEIWDM